MVALGLDGHVDRMDSMSNVMDMIFDVIDAVATGPTLAEGCRHYREGATGDAGGAAASRSREAPGGGDGCGK